MDVLGDGVSAGDLACIVRGGVPGSVRSSGYHLLKLDVAGSISIARSREAAPFKRPICHRLRPLGPIYLHPGAAPRAVAEANVKVVNTAFGKRPSVCTLMSSRMVRRSSVQFSDHGPRRVSSSDRPLRSAVPRDLTRRVAKRGIRTCAERVRTRSHPADPEHLPAASPRGGRARPAPFVATAG